MLEIVLILCLRTSPLECQQKTQQYEGGLFECAMAGQLAAAEWIVSHPKWFLARWRCQPREEHT